MISYSSHELKVLVHQCHFHPWIGCENLQETSMEVKTTTSLITMVSIKTFPSTNPLMLNDCRKIDGFFLILQNSRWITPWTQIFPTHPNDFIWYHKFVHFFDRSADVEWAPSVSCGRWARFGNLWFGTPKFPWSIVFSNEHCNFGR